MNIEQKIKERLEELVTTSPEVIVNRRTTSKASFVSNETKTKELVIRRVSSEHAMQWGANCLNILRLAFGSSSDYYNKYNQIFNSFPSEVSVRKALGIMRAALDDYSRGFVVDLQTAISGEIFQDFVELAKRALAEGNKDVAAVLACSALEDTLKRYAQKKGLAVDDKDMTDVVAALKSQGLVSGAQKTLLSTMPKIRNYAMHANWDKITEPDVNSVIGFVEQFLITYF